MFDVKMHIATFTEQMSRQQELLIFFGKIDKFLEIKKSNRTQMNTTKN